jgi:hypothetical protein
VPKGNVSPYFRATTPDSQYLPIVPTKPASPIKSNLIIDTSQAKTPDQLDGASK